MKKMLIAGMAMVAVLAVSCKSQNAPEETQRVRFSLQGLDVETEPIGAPRRAAAETVDPAAANITDIYVLEGGTVLCHQMDSDPDFGNPVIMLPYGQHSLTFIASGQKNQSMSESGVWSAPNVRNTFGALHSVTVSDNTGEQAVVMTRRNYELKWQSTDNVPEDAIKLKVTISDWYGTLTGTLYAGATSQEKAWTYNDISSYHGGTISVIVGGFTQMVAGFNYTATTTIEFLDESDNVLFSHSKTVPVFSNRTTKISGMLFGGEATSAIQVNTDWGTDYEVDL